MYNVTPEQFARFMEAMKNSQTQAVPPLLVSVKADGEEENPVDIEDA